MKTLSVLSRKGGSGKTTVSVSLALAAQQAGLRVVLADVDPLHSAGEVLRARPEASSFLFETRATKLFLLRDACIRNSCDLLIVDTPTAPDADVMTALNVSDLCLVVTRPTALDVAAIRETVATALRAECPGLPVATASLRSRAAYQHAFAARCGVTEWDAQSEAARDVLRLLAEVSSHLMLPRFSASDPMVPGALRRAA